MIRECDKCGSLLGMGANYVCQRCNRENRTRRIIDRCTDTRVINDNNAKDGVAICSLNLRRHFALLAIEGVKLKFSKFLPDNTILCNKATAILYEKNNG